MKFPCRLKCVLLMPTMIIMFIAMSSAQSDPLPALPADPTNSVVSAASFGKDGLLLTSEDTSTQLRVHGFIQADGRFFDFRFMPDFGQNTPQIQDVYLELKLVS